MKYSFEPPAGREEYARAARAARRRRPGGSPPLWLTALALLITAALCVSLLLARSRLTALDAECTALAGEISALADRNARLTLELEGLFSLGELEEFLI